MTLQHPKVNKRYANNSDTLDQAKYVEASVTKNLTPHFMVSVYV